RILAWRELDVHRLRRNSRRGSRDQPGLEKTKTTDAQLARLVAYIRNGSCFAGVLPVGKCGKSGSSAAFDVHASWRTVRLYSVVWYRSDRSTERHCMDDVGGFDRVEGPEFTRFAEGFQANLGDCRAFDSTGCDRLHLRQRHRIEEFRLP